MIRSWLVAVTLCTAAFLWRVPSSDAQTPFYEGKTITVVIGATGGSLNVGARIVARHLAKHIPGNPTVIVQNMTGAAHLVATNHVFNVAKPDGLMLLAANPNVGIAQLSKVDTVRFDVRKFEWLGSSGPDGVALAIRADLPYKTFDELRKADRELVVGTTGPGSNAHDFPLLLKEFAGAKFKLVSGYPANADILLAIERKEVDVWAAFASTVRPAVDRGAVRPLVRSRVPSPGFAELPVDEDLASDPVGKAIMGIRAIPQAIGRAFAAPPGTPADRLTILREAFSKALRDPELRAEGDKAQIEFQHIPPEEVAKGFNTLLQQRPEVLKEMEKYIKFGG
jgi:tripartite-type tricarboxylate transporter receptor subunit TctC